MMFDFEHRLPELASQTVLCVGDLMLDDFVYGEVLRISPEAPAPVITVGRQEAVIGGAGNVARNIASLGAHCLFVGVVGEDDTGRRLMSALLGEPRIEAYLVTDRSRPTTRKVRFVSEHFSTHLLRADWELAKPVDRDSEEALIGHALAAMPRAGAVVLSDYAKGALTPRVIRALIDAARQQGKPLVVDPKGSDFSIYRGATVITPNRKELADATRRAAVEEEDIAAAAAELCRTLESRAVLVTRSEAGMTLVVEGAAPVHVPAYPVKIRDVSGAGDAVVVGKRGTATVSAAELRSRILPAASLASEAKIVFDWSLLDERLGEWRRHGLRVGFTNGCFDLLHPGHVRVLVEARAACDRLVVGLNGDASAARLKGDGRPIQNEKARAEVLAALEAVDLVVIFDEDTPLALIRKVRPMVLVKGGDYRREEVVGREVVEADGGEVIIVASVPGHSTSALVGRSQGRGPR